MELIGDRLKVRSLSRYTFYSVVIYVDNIYVNAFFEGREFFLECSAYYPGKHTLTVVATFYNQYGFPYQAEENFMFQVPKLADERTRPIERQYEAETS